LTNCWIRYRSYTPIKIQDEERKMADDKEARTCKNATCNCRVEDGAKYCSANCEGAGDTTQIDCDCGHPECEGDF
jgi:hypothetical protein